MKTVVTSDGGGGSRGYTEGVFSAPGNGTSKLAQPLMTAAIKSSAYMKTAPTPGTTTVAVITVFITTVVNIDAAPRIQMRYELQI